MAILHRQSFLDIGQGRTDDTEICGSSRLMVSIICISNALTLIGSLTESLTQVRNPFAGRTQLRN